MVNIQDLAFRYPNSPFSLRIDELVVSRSESAAVVGPSGSGKTTLLNLLAGILVPDAGSVVVGGATITEFSDAERRNFRIANIGFVFQDFELIEYLNVRENILLPCSINASLPMTEELRERAVSLAKSMGIDDKLNRQIHKLSHGERQRVAICRALLTRPKLLLADEPTGNLDPSNKTHIVELLTEYVRESEATLIAVTHDHSLLPKFDRKIDFKELLAPVATL